MNNIKWYWVPLSQLVESESMLWQETDVAVVLSTDHETALTQALAEQRERDCRAIREACESCGGTGYEYRYKPEIEECRYCGMPIAAIRAQEGP
jgi:hypothetical protein